MAVVLRAVAGPYKGDVFELTALAELTALEPLTDASSPAALKRAFHKASKVLHPDRVRGLPSPRRTEAEEVFKALSQAYHGRITIEVSI